MFAEVVGNAAGDGDVASGDSCGYDVGSGFDAVGDDFVFRSVQFGDAFYADDAGAGAGDFRAHFQEEVSEVDNFGFARGVLDDGFSVGEHGGHQDIFSAGDGDAIEDDARAFESVGRGGFDVAVFL